MQFVATLVKTGVVLYPS